MTPQDAGEVSRVIGRYGLLEGGAVLTHIRELKEATQLTVGIRSYVEYNAKPYPLQKLLILLALIQSSIDVNATRALKDNVLSFITDPSFVMIINDKWVSVHGRT